MATLVRRLSVYRSKGDLVRHKQTVEDIKKLCTLRQAARICHVAWSTFWWATQPPKFQSTRKINQHTKDRVLAFLSRGDITMQLPDKRHAGKNYMRMDYKQAWAEFIKEEIANGERLLGYTATYELMRANSRPMEEIPQKHCQCIHCLNYSLCLKAMSAAEMNGVVKRTSRNCLAITCGRRNKGYNPNVTSVTDETTSIIDLKRRCIFGLCGNCGTKKLLGSISELNRGKDMTKKVAWREWAYEKRNLKDGSLRKELLKFRREGELCKLVMYYVNSTAFMVQHLFNANWQGKDFELLLRVLEVGDVVFVMDFAMNLELKRKVVPQGDHWGHHGVTMHPVIVYYRCRNGGCVDLVKEELIMLSDDMTHDAHIVNVFEDRALEYLYQKGVPVERLFEYTDNCAGQYKCKISFDYMSRRSIPVQRSFFGAQHGKGPGDAAIGRVKRRINNAVLNDQLDTGSFVGLYEYCVQALQTPEADPECCLHSTTAFFKVHEEEVDRTFESNAQTLHGTQKLHCVRNTGKPGFIDIRLTSCSCRACVRSVGYCENKDVVPNFQRRNIFGRDQTEDQDFTNENWSESSAADLERTERGKVKKFGSAPPATEEPVTPSDRETRSSKRAAANASRPKAKTKAQQQGL